MVKKQNESTEICKEITDLDGVGPTSAQKLADAGINSLMALAVSSPASIAELVGMSETVARKLIQTARKELKLGFEKAAEYAKKQSNKIYIKTECKSFDDMLGGGIEPGHITEFYGQFGTGKTFLSHVIAIKTLKQLPESKVVYIDTEGTFSTDRITDLAVAEKMDIKDVMDRIFVARAFTGEHQILLVDELDKMLQSDKSYKLIIIDSLTSHLRAEMSGRGQLANRQQLLNKHLHQLIKLSDVNKLAVIVTNQVMSDPGQMFGNPTKPVGGNIVGHASSHRVFLRPGKSSTIVAKLIDSYCLPQTECNYSLIKEGLKDEIDEE